MKLIAGLGNPTEKYAHTRHNLGFDAIDALAKILDIKVEKNERRALTGTAFYRGEKLLLAKPQTYMNLSGESISRLMDYYGIAPQELLVLVDDINLGVGVVRIRRGGSDGGHNGLKSITGMIGTQDYARLRIGAGAPEKESLTGFVLSGFAADERIIVDETVSAAAEAALVFAAEGVEVAMNRYNGRKWGSVCDEKI